MSILSDAQWNTAKKVVREYAVKFFQGANDMIPQFVALDDDVNVRMVDLLAEIPPHDDRPPVKKPRVALPPPAAAAAPAASGRAHNHKMAVDMDGERRSARRPDRPNALLREELAPLVFAGPAGADVIRLTPPARPAANRLGRQRLAEALHPGDLAPADRRFSRRRAAQADDRQTRLNADLAANKLITDVRNVQIGKEELGPAAAPATLSLSWPLDARDTSTPSRARASTRQLLQSSLFHCMNDGVYSFHCCISQF